MGVLEPADAMADADDGGVVGFARGVGEEERKGNEEVEEEEGERKVVGGEDEGKDADKVKIEMEGVREFSEDETKNEFHEMEENDGEEGPNITLPQWRQIEKGERGLEAEDPVSLFSFSNWRRSGRRVVWWQPYRETRRLHQYHQQQQLADLPIGYAPTGGIPFVGEASVGRARDKEFGGLP